ncbi:MAG: MmcQ/YjbR family DNA-binding protein [Herpetosiphonaceae bacterium]|nr:MmcQ/YjbR family DNA-binding protein [Herpetosiphonaceae bacterium]
MYPPVTFDTVREIVRTLPEVEEGTSYGTPAFHVRKKLLARLREDGETLVIKTDFAEREVRIQLAPETFFVTYHYVGYPLMLVQLATVEPDDLRLLLEQAWRMVAPKRLIQARDGEGRGRRPPA